MSEAAISEAIQAEQIFMQSDVERWQYEQHEKALRDYLSEMSACRSEGAEEMLLQNLHHLMDELSLPPERAMDILHIADTERARYAQLLKQ